MNSDGEVLAGFGGMSLKEINELATNPSLIHICHPTKIWFLNPCKRFLGIWAFLAEETNFKIFMKVSHSFDQKQ